MKVVLTGISGFLGAEVARRLVRDGSEVCAIVRANSSLDHVADLRDSVSIQVHDGSTAQLIDLLGQFRPDQVMHLASNFLAEHRPGDIDGLIHSNVLFPTQLLEAMTAAGCRQIINTGTSWQHFGTQGFRPVNLYASTKQAFEDVLAYYADAHGVSSISLKLYDTYGPNDRRRKLIRLLLDAAKNGARLEMSPGEQVIDMMHSDDVVEAFMAASRRLAARTAPSQETFLVSGERLCLRDLVTLLERLGGRSIDVAWGARPYRAREVMLPVEPADAVLPGWRPTISLESGLRELVNCHV